MSKHLRDLQQFGLTVVCLGCNMDIYFLLGVEVKFLCNQHIVKVFVSHRAFHLEIISWFHRVCTMLRSCVQKLDVISFEVFIKKRKEKRLIHGWSTQYLR